MHNQTCVPGTIVPICSFDPTTMNNPVPPVEYPAWDIALKAVFYILAMIMNFTGNSIVLLIILLNKKMRTVTNVLILNLAVSDLMVGAFCMWVHLGNNISDDYLFGSFFCKFSTFSQVMSVTASVITLTIISVERLIAVVFPFRHHCSPVVSAIIIGCTWIVAIATASPHLFVRRKYELKFRDREQIWCTENWAKYYKDNNCRTWQPGKITYYIVEGIIMFFVPIAVMIVAYLIIAFKLFTRRAPGSLITSTSTAQDKAKRKVTKMLAIVLAAFIICWTPQQVMLLYDQLGEESSQSSTYSSGRYVAIFIAYFNSALNPILYSGFNENFRSGFIEAFRCLLIQRRNRIGPGSSGLPWTVRKQRSGDGNCSDLKAVCNSQDSSLAGPSRSHHLKLRQEHLQSETSSAIWATTQAASVSTVTETQNVTPDIFQILELMSSQTASEGQNESKV